MQFFIKLRLRPSGFTLIELLVVIAIIGLLSTLAMVAMGNARQKARDAKRVSDIKQVQTALELYFNDRNGYPTNAGGIELGGTSATCVDYSGINNTCTQSTKYMASVPKYPAPSDGTNCASPNNSYWYVSAAINTYSINYCLGSDTGGISGNFVHRATPAGRTDP